MKISINKAFLIFTTFYIYFIMALFESSRGNFIPFYIDEFQINNATISLILSLYTLGCIIGSFFGGQLCHKLGHKFVYILGSIISTAAVLIAPFTPNIFILALFNFIFGLGRASLSVAVDSLVPVLSFGFEVILMNITHFMYGLGSFAGQSIYGIFLNNGVNWRTIYLYLGIFFAASIFFASVMKAPNTRVTKSSLTIKKEVIYKNPVIYLFILAVTFELITEAVINTWFISYIRNDYGLNPANASFYASIFFFLFALGRLSGGFIVNKTGDIKGLKLFMISAAVSVTAGLLLRKSGLILIAVSGFFVSIGFPTLMVIISKAFNENASYAIGIITTVSNILYVIIFNITGILNDKLGSYLAFYMAPVSMACSFLILNMISKKITSKNN